MSGARSLTATARRRVGWFVRDRFPHRPVVREVQGVRMVLPWSHRLPDYVRAGADYGQNLVELARELASRGPLTVLDVGANVGDSTLQILNAADGKVLCVEGDKAYLEFLHRNADADPRITIVEALLETDAIASGATAVRKGGTTRFTDGGAGTDAMPSISAVALREQNPDFADLRLAKSDTDGFDVVLIPTIAETWADSRPVLFFEYDPYLIRLVGLDPLDVWTRLAELGYETVAVWDHGGTALGRSATTEIAPKVGSLELERGARPASRSYWDVALAHRDDTVGLAALDALIPARQAL
jgi:FkbM family methyltransferase